MLIAGCTLLAASWLGLIFACPDAEPQVDGGYWLDRDRQARRSRNRF